MTRQHNRQRWARRLRRYQPANQTIVDLCRSENISQASFYYWRKRLGNRDLEAFTEVDPQFAEVTLQPDSIIDSSNSGKSPSAPLSTARLTNGIRIELGGDLAQVRHIVAQLLEHQAEATSESTEASNVCEASSC